MDIAVNGLDFTSLTSCWESQQYDPKLTNYKSLIYPDLALDRLMCIGPHFIYIFDCSISKFHYLSENVVNILGYHPDYLLAKSMVFLKEILHPEDLQVVFESTKKSWEFVKSVPEVQRKSYKISCDFRVKRPTDNTSVYSNRTRWLIWTKKAIFYMCWGCALIFHIGTRIIR